MPGITRNPYQQAAAVCCLLALVCALVGPALLPLPLLTVALVFSLLAYTMRGDFPS
jgi:hypothetical protein